MSDTCELYVNGTGHKGWQEVSIVRSLEQFAHTFDLSFVEQWSALKDPIPIREGDECSVKLNGKTVITGFVVDAAIDEDAQSHNFSVSGFSRTGDLVECSAIHGKGSWKNATLKQIAEDLCNPFLVKVVVDSALGDMGGPFKHFAIEDGEMVFDTLERACRMRGIIMTTTLKGDLRFTAIAAKRTKTVIEYGVNAMHVGRSGSWRQRFSDYTLKAQSAGGPDLYGRDASQMKFTIKDADVTRYRPLIVKAEVAPGGIAKKLEARATWERNIRAGRAVRLSYVVQGWENAEGVWEPNTLTRVKDPRMQVDSNFLIISTQAVRGLGGTATAIELADPKSMTIEPLTKQPKGAAKNSLFMQGQK